MSKLKVGDICPKFELLDQNGNLVSSDSLKGQKILIYFYPKAMTPGCTIQSCKVRDAFSELENNNVRSIGVSPDSPERQKKFDNRHNLGFTLLSDPDHSMSEAFGVWIEKSMFGKKYMGILRSSFLIDENGLVIGVWYKVSPKNTVPNALDALN